MLRARLTTEMKEAMKAGEKAKLATIRMIQAALKDKDIEARGLGKEPATDDEILALLQKMIKQRAESASVYEQGGRPELAENERAEIAIIEGYLPRQMDEAETKAAVDAAIAEAGAAGPKDMGKVIAVLKGAYAGRMDFAKASGLVKASLNAKA
ncbi:GatB/YqeY domain-containing protein [Methylobacterium sp. WL30]|uniref:GatB/YqeY domain-containing protein n=1 Tax=unclassified Methylobacterium TaxID=2615210 RepID=UPI0011CB7875|nr:MULTISPECIES: GatB/YqeY domain-containing protein [unclassified Methylobacterium]TXM88018.1 GatB/YqeY domain-containing protein [Methylobacterium sp. WL116]TXN40870.1 GatB/YqeY domain-containing protein [Methylobacterium sp. WL93]TXN49545.1 GatB/YqeY domain-containing protein [Methylobacterium sp. WL119]TXN70733.1 GatB/YqeY domain-containing protein [Methylobacterium sp. WL30]